MVDRFNSSRHLWLSWLHVKGSATHKVQHIQLTSDHSRWSTVYSCRLAGHMALITSAACAVRTHQHVAGLRRYHLFASAASDRLALLLLQGTENAACSTCDVACQGVLKLPTCQQMSHAQKHAHHDWICQSRLPLESLQKSTYTKYAAHMAYA